MAGCPLNHPPKKWVPTPRFKQQTMGFLETTEGVTLLSCIHLFSEANRPVGPGRIRKDLGEEFLGAAANKVQEKKEKQAP